MPILSFLQASFFQATFRKSQTTHAYSTQTMPSLKAHQLQDVQDVLRVPLTGQEVLIPLGPQAFVLGKLQPPLQRSEANQDDEEEMVEYHHAPASSATTARVEIMTRSQARARLQEEIDVLRDKQKSTKPKPSTKSTPPIARTLACIEIREEYDEKDRPVSAQAINLSKQLKLIQKEYDQDNDDTDDDETSVDDDGNGSVASFGETIPLEKSARLPASDTEYDRIASRLEELARLEDEGEKEIPSEIPSSTKSVATSARRATNSGWGKGFLNAKSSSGNRKLSSKVAVAKTNSANKAAAPVSDIGQAADLQKSSLKEESTSTDQNRSDVGNQNQAAAINAKPKVVKFSSEPDRVKEIPRIVRESFGTAPSEEVPLNPHEPVAAPSLVVVPPKPRSIIDQSVLADAVQERPRRSTEASQTQPSPSTVATDGRRTIDTSTAAVDSERLVGMSRFARERQRQKQ
jgi:hypothetical protein